jgi:hypothetical protein
MLMTMSLDGSSDFDALGLLHRGAKIKKPRKVLLQQDIKPPWFLFQEKSHENSETFWPQLFMA